MTPYRLLVLSLGAAFCALALVNWRLAVTPVDVTPPDADEEREIAAAATPDGPHTSPSRASLDDLNETLARPLFAPDRRPPAPAEADDTATDAAQAPAPETDPSRLRLVGMMRVGAADQRALIRVSGEAHASWVAVGAEVGGWTVRAIEAGKVVVERSSRRAELMLRTTPGAAPESE